MKAIAKSLLLRYYITIRSKDFYFYRCKMVINEIKLKELLKIGKGENINDKVAQKIAKFLGVENTDLLEDNVILKTLQTENKLKVSDGLYHETQIKLMYNSNHLEGSKLTEEQTRYIFETKTVGELLLIANGTLNKFLTL